MNQDGTLHENGKIMRIVKKLGMSEFELEKAYAGDIVSIAGFQNSSVGNTINEVGKQHVIESIPIDPPTLSLTVAPNDSPLQGKDGNKLTIDVIRARVEKESQDDVSLHVEERGGSKNTVTMHGRGDLHLGVLMGKMRREGFELQISTPQVIMRTCEKTGDKLEPYEEVQIDTEASHLN